MEYMVFSYDSEEIDKLVSNADAEIVRVCQACGKQFVPYKKRAKKLKFCNRIHYNICPVCSKEFQVNFESGISCINKTCSKSCSNKLKKLSMEQSMMKIYGVSNPGQMQDHQDKVTKTCLEKYGVENYSQSEEFKQRAHAAWEAKSLEEIQERYQKSVQTNQERYGVDNGAQSDQAKEKQKVTNRERYGADWYRQTEECESRIRQTTKDRYGDEVYFRTADYRDKVHETSLQKYGVDHYTQSAEYQANMAQSNLQRWGVSCVFQRPDIRKKAMQRTSQLEIRLHNMLQEYDIQYETEYYVRRDSHSHHFDAYLPDYNILIDVDGIYYHAYIEDPDGLKSRDDYDDVRLYCVPDNYIYLILVESDFERELRRLQKVIHQIDKGVFNHDSHLFKWCRSIGFPYYNYDNTYLLNQFNRLCNYEMYEYRPSCEIGISLIQQFHPSIFDCKFSGHMSVKEAWDDDIMLKKVIANRLIYQNNVNPSKILSGFNISKIAPKVSIFNPVLAKYLICRYLSEFDEIFDPFSGFSGRLLGAIACNKRYVGSDVRDVSIEESSRIIHFLGKEDSCVVNVADIRDSYGSYDCLLTCPPYNDKEIYICNQLNLDEDDWIDMCLDHFKCNRYVFVVGKTTKYKNYVVEELKCKSHFRKNSEYVIIINTQ